MRATLFSISTLLPFYFCLPRERLAFLAFRARG
jgi:hypothetical protein